MRTKDIVRCTWVLTITILFLGCINRNETLILGCIFILYPYSSFLEFSYRKEIRRDNIERCHKNCKYGRRN